MFASLLHTPMSERIVPPAGPLSMSPKPRVRSDWPGTAPRADSGTGTESTAESLAESLR